MKLNWYSNLMCNYSYKIYWVAVLNFSWKRYLTYRYKLFRYVKFVNVKSSTYKKTPKKQKQNKTKNKKHGIWTCRCIRKQGRVFSLPLYINCLFTYSDDVPTWAFKLCNIIYLHTVTFIYMYDTEINWLIYKPIRLFVRTYAISDILKIKSYVLYLTSFRERERERERVLMIEYYITNFLYWKSEVV